MENINALPLALPRKFMGNSTENPQQTVDIFLQILKKNPNCRCFENLSAV